MPGLFHCRPPVLDGCRIRRRFAPHLPMTAHEWMVLCGDLLQYVIGPVLRIWITARIDAKKPRRNRNASRKRSR
jgi:hypothetical protein